MRRAVSAAARRVWTRPLPPAIASAGAALPRLPAHLAAHADPWAVTPTRERFPRSSPHSAAYHARVPSRRDGTTDRPELRLPRQPPLGVDDALPRVDASAIPSGASGAPASFATKGPSDDDDDDARDRREADAAGSASPSPSASASDSGSHTWVDRHLPPSAVPYAKLARLDRPIGTHLLAWPCFWSIALAAPRGALPDAHLLALFGVGALLLRGAGCTVNDLWDRDIDRMVARTRDRPIASGAVTPLNALAFLGAQLGLGLGVLLQLNDLSVALGASSLALVAAYPLMKRVTDWPQAFLGLTFNWGALLGYAAATGTLEPTVVAPLYLSGASWTLLYDTVYAHQDKADDARVGVRSTALRLGEETREYLGRFGGVAIAGLVGAGYGAGCGWPFYAGAGLAAAHLAWQTATVDLDDPSDCAAKFRSNAQYGGIVFAAIVAGKLI